MTRFMFTLYGPRSKAELLRVVEKAPAGSRVEIKGPKRTNDQNSLMWVLLTELSLTLPWGGKHRSPDVWKDLFMDGLRAALAADQLALPAIDGSGRQVLVGNSTSDLSVEEMTMLIELIHKFGAEHGVAFDDDAQLAGEVGRTA